MKLAVLLILFSLPSFACTINEDRVQDDVFENARDLFSIDEESTIVMVDAIKTKGVGPDANVAFLELLTEDKFFDRPMPKDAKPCPDRIVRVYRYYGQDKYRRCNGFLKSEILGGVHEVIYRNCGSN